MEGNYRSPFHNTSTCYDQSQAAATTTQNKQTALTTHFIKHHNIARTFGLAHRNAGDVSSLLRHQLESVRWVFDRHKTQLLLARSHDVGGGGVCGEESQSGLLTRGLVVGEQTRKILDLKRRKR